MIKLREKIKKNLERILVVGGVGALSLTLNGCLGAGMQAISPLADNPGVGTLLNAGGVMLEGAEQHDYRMQEAAEGRDQTNVNVYQQPQQQVGREELPFKIFSDRELGNVHAVVCNYWKDFNGNGKMDHDEYKGVKRSFGKDEKISIYLSGNVKTAGFEYDLLDKNGKTVGTDALKEESYGLQESYEPGQLPAGTYTAIFKRSGKPITNLDFEVKDK